MICGPVEIEDIPRANKLLYRTSWILMGLCAVVETVLNLLLKMVRGIKTGYGSSRNAEYIRL